MNAVAVAARHSHGQGWNLHPHPPPTVTKRYYTLATLEGIAWIDDIVVPLEPDYIERMTTNATASPSRCKALATSARTRVQFVLWRQHPRSLSNVTRLHSPSLCTVFH